MKNKMHVFCTKYKSLKEILDAVKQWQEENVLPLTVLQDVVIECFSYDDISEFFMAFYKCHTEEGYSTNTAFVHLYILPYVDEETTVVSDLGNENIQMVATIIHSCGELYEMVAEDEATICQRRLTKLVKKAAKKKK